ncbi:unnamed protein product [Cylindrotheca closterium]|uniref:Phospholipase B-like n=1 Tax=Cylindrotheca closterium TaxID=2856 RepID=A0AAD2CVC3_9STRA|nr:unnamed protein product [Cylindrotheca closterium]
MKRQRHNATVPSSWKFWLSCWILLFQQSNNKNLLTEARIVDDYVSPPTTATTTATVSSSNSMEQNNNNNNNNIDDVASIDQDLKEIGQLLRIGDFDAARSLYEEGSYSASYAQVFLNEPVQQEIEAGEVVTGPANGGGIASGIVQETVRPGEHQVKIRYVALLDTEEDTPVQTSRTGSPATTTNTATTTTATTTKRTSKQSLIRSKVIPHFSEKSKRHRDDRNGDTAAEDTTTVATAAINTDHYCHVGGNPEPVTGGCFKASGTLTNHALGRDYDYQYDVLNGNHNARSISKLSRGVVNDGSLGFHMLSKEFLLFTSYFGRTDYADHLIQTAFDAVNDPTVSTEMDRSNLHFYHFHDEALASFLYTFMAHLTLWMETVVHLDVAIEICDAPSERQEAIQQWDQAASMYVGSRGSKRGILHHELAAKQCQVFHTCPPDKYEVSASDFEYQEGQVHINEEIADDFQTGRQGLLNGDCDTVKARKSKIVRSMTIPLIQATLLEAYKVDRNGDDNYIMGPDASAIAYGMTIIPLINACNEDDATALFDSLGDLHTPASFWAGANNNPHTKPLSFSTVKQILERNYSCLKIKCSDVGGIWNYTSNNQYMDGAEPCDGFATTTGKDAPPSENAATTGAEPGESNDGVGFFTFLMFLVVAGVAVFGLTVRRFTKEKRETKRSVEANRNLHEQSQCWDEREIEITLD